MTNVDLLSVYPAARLALIEARRARGIRQYEVAAMLNVSWPYYSMIELGEVTPEPRVAEKIEKMLGINILEEYHDAR